MHVGFDKLLLIEITKTHHNKTIEKNSYMGSKIKAYASDIF